MSNNQEILRLDTVAQYASVQRGKPRPSHPGVDITSFDT